MRLLAERGIDLSGHRATALDEEELRLADLILVSEEAHRQAIFYRSPQALHKVWLLTELNRRRRSRPIPTERANRPTGGFWRRSTPSWMKGLLRCASDLA